MLLFLIICIFKKYNVINFNELFEVNKDFRFYLYVTGYYNAKKKT